MVLRGAGSETRAYFWAGAACVLFVMTRFLSTDIMDNEWAYSIGPIQVLNPGFLSNDPLLKEVRSYFLVYNVLASPVFYLFDYRAATLICRVAIWIFQVAALTHLFRTLKVSWWGCILVFLFWLNIEQTLAAGEWIIGSASAKPVCYGFIFLSLDSMLKERWTRCGVYSGIATSFHVIVGGWSALAVCGALLVRCLRSGDHRPLLGFIVPAGALSAPGMVPAFLEVMGKPSGLTESAAAEAARLSVTMANPFHLDPAFFITGMEYFKFAFFFLGVVFFFRKTTPSDSSNDLVAYISTAVLVFVAGIIGRASEAFRFLKYYPFRLADAMIPLAFWIGFVLLLQKIMRERNIRTYALVLVVPATIGFSKYAIGLCESTPGSFHGSPSFYASMVRTEPRLTAYNVREKIREWSQFLGSGRKDDLREMESWVMNNTRPASVIVVPPWIFSFPLDAQRLDLVSFKRIPVDSGIFAWMDKMERLNRGAFGKTGFGMLKELRMNYPNLTSEEVSCIKKRYGPEYMLADARSRSEFPILHGNGSYVLYQIDEGLCHEDRPGR